MVCVHGCYDSKRETRALFPKKGRSLSGGDLINTGYRHGARVDIVLKARHTSRDKVAKRPAVGPTQRCLYELGRIASPGGRRRAMADKEMTPNLQ